MVPRGGGTGYASAPSITFSAPTGSNPVTATGTSAGNATGSVAGVNVTLAGNGYTSAPTVTFTGGGFTTPASGTAVMTDNQRLATTTSGSGAGRRPVGGERGTVVREGPPWRRPGAAYVHVPFCAHHCGYCDFAVAAGQDHRIDEYLDALAAELATLGAPQRVRTIFLGGGTPTHLSPAQLERLLTTIAEWLPLGTPARFAQTPPLAPHRRRPVLSFARSRA